MLGVNLYDAAGAHRDRDWTDKVPEPGLDEIRLQGRHTYAICAFQHLCNRWVCGLVRRLPKRFNTPDGDLLVWMWRNIRGCVHVDVG